MKKILEVGYRSKYLRRYRYSQFRSGPRTAKLMQRHAGPHPEFWPELRADLNRKAKMSCSQKLLNLASSKWLTKIRYSRHCRLAKIVMILHPEFRRIHTFLGLPDPDSSVRGTDPDLFIIKQKSWEKPGFLPGLRIAIHFIRIRIRNPDFYSFATSLWLLISQWCTLNVPSKSYKQKG